MEDTLDKIGDQQDHSNLNVLLVEDDEIMRTSLEDRLVLEEIPVRAVSPFEPVSVLPEPHTSSPLRVLYSLT